MHRRFLLAALCATVAACKSRPNEAILSLLDKQDCASLESPRIRICKYDYAVDGQAVEALSFRPGADGRFPAVLLIPGYERTARDLIALGVRLSSEGFAAVAVSQPGFGKSKGPPDYVGPKTLKVLTTAYRKLQQEPFADPKRMGIYGYSRGGMAASLLALELEDVRAVVLGAGIYDFQKAYDEVTLPGVRENMKAETGMTPEAVRERSSILRMEQLHCPVLILHGEKDKNVPVSQARLLRERLTALHKEFEIHLFPGREHSIGPEVASLTVDFLQRRLK